ncbi:hypothetical protein M404DRAFT_998222 [Pisolithus tinctorius Marx 270]|uniref:Uncharacterized protein n=1 Tax=Pisolithus tinctorius Marx 270 TaxID=870435 RepID=A0A0C3PGI6_PISTI|nr:hypothetical protein M404DRAFT_998222 [Pisolithus tinctorius Marx 270]
MSTPGPTDVHRQDVIPEKDEYREMPHSLRRVLTPPQEDDEHATRQRSVLFDSSVSPPSSPTSPASPYFRQRWPPTLDHSTNNGVSRARQSVSSIGSCSTVQTRTAPVKSILTRHDSGISMATTKTRRTKKRSPPSVKFVDPLTGHNDDSKLSSPPCSPPLAASSSSRRKLTPAEWFMKWWRRKPNPPPRPTISGPYRLSQAASLAESRAKSRKPEPGKLKRLWLRVTNATG